MAKIIQGNIKSATHALINLNCFIVSLLMVDICNVCFHVSRNARQTYNLLKTVIIYELRFCELFWMTFSIQYIYRWTKEKNTNKVRAQTLLSCSPSEMFMTPRHVKPWISKVIISCKWALPLANNAQQRAPTVVMSHLSKKVNQFLFFLNY